MIIGGGNLPEEIRDRRPRIARDHQDRDRRSRIRYPVIVASSQVVGPIAGPPVFRTVQVQTRPKPLIPAPGAMVVLSTVDFAGGGITTDSFDSSNTNYSTGGMYDPKKARDHGDVVTLSSQVNLLDVGNGKVKGMVRTGPEGQASVGAIGRWAT